MGLTCLTIGNIPNTSSAENKGVHEAAPLEEEEEEALPLFDGPADDDNGENFFPVGVGDEGAVAAPPSVADLVGDEEDEALGEAVVAAEAAEVLTEELAAGCSRLKP